MFLQVQPAIQARAGRSVQANSRRYAKPSLLAGLPARRRCVRVSAVLEPGKMVAAASDKLFDLAVQHANVLATLSDDAEKKTGGGGGPFDWLSDAFEKFLTVLDGGLEKAGVPYSYGFAIILLTLLVKLATFPLTQKQVQSTVALQQLQPYVRELQTKYAGNQEQLQIETAKLYREAGVNPLAGCLPTLATIPVFIGLYRALTQAADDGLLNDAGFFWIPSLAGPNTLADREAGTGLSWLFPLQNGAPPIGWHDAGLYLILPILLIASQYFSQKIMSPQSNTNDPAQQQTQAILKFLPLMIGWFSLNVPSGLTLYWFINNILSTAQQLYLRSTTKVNLPLASTSGKGAVVDVTATSRPAPKAREEEKVKKVTGKELGSRKKKSEGGSDSDGESSASGSSEAASGFGGSSTASSGGGGDRGEKFRARKAREAAAKAAAKAAPTATPAPPPPAAAPPTGQSPPPSDSGSGSDKA